MIPEKDIKIDRYGKDNGDSPPSHAIVATHIPTGKYVIEKMKGEGFLTSDNVVDRLNELVFPGKEARRFKVAYVPANVEEIGIRGTVFAVTIFGEHEIAVGTVLASDFGKLPKMEVLSCKVRIGRPYRESEHLTELKCKLITDWELSFIPRPCLAFENGYVHYLTEVLPSVFPEKKYKDISEFFEQKGPEDIERFVDKNLDISQFVYARMKEKGWKVKDLAEAVGKSENKISKWLTGCHDLTLRDITRMESALGVDIITVSK